MKTKTAPHLLKSPDGTINLGPIWDIKERQCELYRASLQRFWETYNQAEQPLKAWVDEVSKAQWKTPQDIKNKYRTADFLSNNRVVFDIKGNHYGLIIVVAYRFQAVYIKFVGTHAEYDKIDANTMDM